jgi:hypothetical protein
MTEPVERTDPCLGCKADLPSGLTYFCTPRCIERWQAAQRIADPEVSEDPIEEDEVEVAVG